MMVKDYIGINHNYSKSEYDFFPIIRDEDNYPEPGEGIRLGFQYIERKATVIFKPRMKLREVPTSLLCFETGTEKRADAVRMLEEVFRKDLDPDSELTILFVRIEG